MLYEIVQNMSKETRRLLCDIFVMLVEKCKTQPEAVKGLFYVTLVDLGGVMSSDDLDVYMDNFKDITPEEIYEMILEEKQEK